MSAAHRHHVSSAGTRPARRRAVVLALVGGAAFAAMLTGSAAAAPGAVDLGTAESFAVLAGSGITNTGPTTITGDVGAFPTPTQTGFDSVTLAGTNHGDGLVTQGAKTDLVTAYDDAAGRTGTSIAVELGSTTLLPGVYTSPALGLTGALTLDAQGDPNAEFIFQAGSTLITAADSSVVLINGADPCRVVWQVGSSATFDTGTSFAGDVLADTSISALAGATFRGRLLALDGAVTLDTNTITSSACAPTEPVTTATAPAAPADVPATATPTAGAPPSSPQPSLPATGAPVTAAGVVGVALVAVGTVLHLRARPTRGTHLRPR